MLGFFFTGWNRSASRVGHHHVYPHSYRLTPYSRSMSLFTTDGGLFVPSLLTTGPWRPDAQHGGPPSALLGRATERALEPGEVVARISVELVKPVPLEPLAVAARRVPVSRRVAHIEAEIRRDDAVVASSTALVLRSGDLPEPRWRPEPDPAWAVAAPDAVVRPPGFGVSEAVTYHQSAVEHRITRGGFAEAGAATSWVQLLHPLVEGEPTSPLCSLLSVADFGSGISSVYWESDGVGLINADLTIALSRPPVGSWFRIESETTVGPGMGLATTRIGDELGPVGVGTQSLVGISF